MKIAYKTKTPKLFCNTYWGNRPFREVEDEECVRNRDMFVREFGIQSKRYLNKKLDNYIERTLPR